MALAGSGAPHDGVREVLNFVENFPSTQCQRLALAALLALYGSIRLFDFLRRFQLFKWVRSQGISELIHWRFNASLFLFLLLIVFQVSLQVSSHVASLDWYSRAYAPIEPILAMSVLALILFNFGALITRAIRLKYKNSVWERLREAYATVANRGISIAELVLVPVGFLFPWKPAIDFVSQRLQI